MSNIDLEKTIKLIFEPQREGCKWSQDDYEGDYYQTECGNDFILSDGTPENNEFKYCTFCGEPIKQILFESE